ncbi:hypothetical protein CO614_04060 [Lysobacteraceae bacterium NML120232]|nr:hypothetical protein CO614_04060 [Xanthomonadaceae bacterium NML120232]
MMLEYPRPTWGHSEHGGETSRHAFCFGSYFAPEKQGFGALRVMNQTQLAAGEAWQPLRRANMEIITWVVAGSLLQHHADGSQTRIDAGQLQCLSAGRGIEYRQRAAADAHFWQFWIRPAHVNAEPGIDMALLSLSGSDWLSPALPRLTGAASLRFAQLDNGQSLKAILQAERRYWLQIIQGEVSVAGKHHKSGDALAWQGECGELEISGSGMESAQLLLIELLK